MKENWKKLLRSCAIGAMAGLAMQLLFTLWSSWLRGDGTYYFASYQLIRRFGSQRDAVTACAAGASFVGMIWGGASLIFRETDWSLLKQTLVHGLVCMLPSLTTAYWLQWAGEGRNGLTQYLLLFGSIYVVNWIVRYWGMRKWVTQINTGLMQWKRSEDRIGEE